VVGLARTRPDEERRWLERIRLWSAARHDCLWLDRVETYRHCRVAGVVTRLRLDPRAGVTDVSVTDGSASLSARWPIKGSLGQLRAAPGAGLILEGMARIGPSGEMLMLEPAFEIVPGPDQE
jgi:hypothetical protein